MKSAAIVQCGHIGDIFLCWPMARQLKADGYRVTWYAVPPYTDVARACPDVDEVYFADQLRPSVGDEPYQRACWPALEHARRHHDIALCPQINPLHQHEYLSGREPYINFMYAVTGMKPERPALPASDIPKPGTQPRVLLNLASNSTPVRIWWDLWDRVAGALSHYGVSVLYNQQPGFEWQGEARPYMVKPLPSPRDVLYLAQGCEAVISVSSAPLWSAWALSIPAVCLLPAGALGECNSLAMHRRFRSTPLDEWDAIDWTVRGDGTMARPEQDMCSWVLHRCGVEAAA